MAENHIAEERSNGKDTDFHTQVKALGNQINIWVWIAFILAFLLSIGIRAYVTETASGLVTSMARAIVHESGLTHQKTTATVVDNLSKELYGSDSSDREANVYERLIRNVAYEIYFSMSDSLEKYASRASSLSLADSLSTADSASTADSLAEQFLDGFESDTRPELWLNTLVIAGIQAIFIFPFLFTLVTRRAVSHLTMNSSSSGYPRAETLSEIIQFHRYRRFVQVESSGSGVAASPFRC